MLLIPLNLTDLTMAFFAFRMSCGFTVNSLGVLTFTPTRNIRSSLKRFWGNLRIIDSTMCRSLMRIFTQIGGWKIKKTGRYNFCYLLVKNGLFAPILCPYVCSSVHVKQLDSQRTDSREISYLSILRKICPENSSLIEIGKEWCVQYTKTYVHLW